MTLRLDTLYDTIVELEERIEDAKLRNSSIEMKQSSGQYLQAYAEFRKLYDIISDEEKKKPYYLSYKKKFRYIKWGSQSDLLKSIEFNFPIYIRMVKR